MIRTVVRMKFWKNAQQIVPMTIVQLKMEKQALASNLKRMSAHHPSANVNSTTEEQEMGLAFLQETAVCISSLPGYNGHTIDLKMIFSTILIEKLHPKLDICSSNYA